MDNEIYEKPTLISSYICNGLFSIVEADSKNRRMTNFCKLFERY